MNSSLARLGLLLFCGWSPCLLRAQGTAEPAWQDGLRLLDSASPADIIAAESILRKSMAGGGQPAEAICTLALVRLRQDEAGEALSLVSSLPTRFDAARLQTTHALALRIRLCAALMVEDGPQAVAAFRDLVRLIVMATGDPVDLRYAAITIGVVVAMLEPDLAESPISKRDLGIARECMLNSRIFGVVGAYSSAYAQASDRAAELTRQFGLIADKGIEATAADNQARMQALDQSLSELAEQKELTNEIFRNAREQTQQNSRDRRRLDGQISAINAKLRQPTPGHPGPPRPAPPPPPGRSVIRVDEFEIRTDLDYVSRNGELVRVPVTRQVRRPQYDIDRERDQKYQQILRDYDRVKDDYDRYLQKHQQALKSWMEADDQRRKQLNQERAEAEAKRAELVAATESIKEHQRDTAKQLSTQRNQKEQETFEVELQGIALAAVKAKAIAAAFRPRNFPVISWTQEKTLLQRAP